MRAAKNSVSQQQAILGDEQDGRTGCCAPRPFQGAEPRRRGARIMGTLRPGM